MLTKVWLAVLRMLTKENTLAEFNMGYNGSENFPEGKRFGFFPAYSLGCVASKRRFLAENDYVTFLKVRGSLVR